MFKMFIYFSVIDFSLKMKSNFLILILKICHFFKKI